MKLRSSVNFGLLFLFQTFLGLDLGGGLAIGAGS